MLAPDLDLEYVMQVQKTGQPNPNERTNEPECDRYQTTAVAIAGNRSSYGTANPSYDQKDN